MGARVDPAMQQLLEVIGTDAEQGFLFAEHALLDHVPRGLDEGGGVHLTVSSLQHVQHAALDGELEVLDLVVLLLQRMPHGDELFPNSRHLVLELGDRLRRAYPRHDVLALRVRQVLAEQHVFPGAGIAGKGHARRAVVAHIAEHHGADVHGRAVGHCRRDLKLATVVHRSLPHPGTEYRLDGHLKLLRGVLGELAAEIFNDGPLVVGADLFQSLDRELVVVGRALPLLGSLEDLDEPPLLGPHGDLPKRLDQSAIRVVGEARVPRRLAEADHDFIVHAEVENRVHHARHRQGSAGTYRHQQRIAGVSAEGLPCLRLQLLDTLPYLGQQAVGKLLAAVVVLPAGLGGNHETGRDRQTDLRHA